MDRKCCPSLRKQARAKGIERASWHVLALKHGNSNDGMPFESGAQSRGGEYVELIGNVSEGSIACRFRSVENRIYRESTDIYRSLN